MTNDICIVSVGIDGREPYSQYASILEQKAKEHGYSTMVWKNEYPPNSPTHQEVPYAFKPFAIKAAKDNGYKKVMWLDCKCYIQKELTKINESLNDDGHWFMYDGGTVGEWCKDGALQLLGITREEAFGISVIAAKHFALNFDKEIAVFFFEEYLKYAIDNGGDAYRGPWKNTSLEASSDRRVKGHRHDQTCASVIVHKLNMEVKENKSIEWRDGWKFREVQMDPEIIFDGYLHCIHNCSCDSCSKAMNDVQKNKKYIPEYFMR